MKNKLKRLAGKPATWIVIGSLLTALGLNVPPQVLEALPAIGPLLVQ